MQFGIMNLQITGLLPAGSPPGGLLAYLAGLDHASLSQPLIANSFHLIELGGDLVSFFPHVYSPDRIARLQTLKAEHGLRFTVHLPLWSIEPSTPAEPVRRGSVRALADCIRATQPLEPEAYVLHAYGALASEFTRMRLPESARPLILSQFQNAARRSIQELLAETGLPSRLLAIETIEFPFEATLALAEELDLSICFDTGHVLVGFSGPIDLFAALEQSLPRLGEVHLHDGPWQGTQRNIGYGKDHQALGKGDLDTGRFLDRLAQAGFTGPIVFELTIAEALESLEVIRDLRPGYLQIGG